MGINVELRDESGDEVGGLPMLVLTYGHLPDFDDTRFPYLRLIDPVADTVFNGLQMKAVIPELERLIDEKPSLELQQVLRLARRCSSEPHTYLTFLGD